MARIDVTLDNDLKRKATRVYNQLGMSLSTAIKVFLVQSVRTRRMPFEPGDYKGNQK